MSHRQEQLNAVLHRAVQSVIARGLNDPRISGLVSVTKVDVAPDKKTATVFVSVLPADRSTLVMHGLRSAALHVRSKVGDMVEMRRVPHFKFELDESLKKQAEVLAAIQRGAKEAGTDAPGADEVDADSHPHGSGRQGSERRNQPDPLTEQKDD